MTRGEWPEEIRRVQERSGPCVAWRARLQSLDFGVTQTGLLVQTVTLTTGRRIDQVGDVGTIRRERTVAQTPAVMVGRNEAIQH